MQTNSGGIIIFIVIFAVVAGLTLFIASLIRNRCPKCGKFWAADEYDSKTKETYRIWDETKREYRNSKKSTFDKYSSKDFIEAVTTEFYKCKFCKHKWEHSYKKKISLENQDDNYKN